MDKRPFLRVALVIKGNALLFGRTNLVSLLSLVKSKAMYDCKAYCLLHNEIIYLQRVCSRHPCRHLTLRVLLCALNLLRPRDKDAVTIWVVVDGAVSGDQMDALLGTTLSGMVDDDGDNDGSQTDDGAVVVASMASAVEEKEDGAQGVCEAVAESKKEDDDGDDA